MKKKFFILSLILFLFGSFNQKVSAKKSNSLISINSTYYRTEVDNIEKLKDTKEKIENNIFVKVFKSVFLILKNFLTKLLDIFNIFKKK